MREEVMDHHHDGPFDGDLEMVFKSGGTLINHCLCLLTLIAYINPMGLWFTVSIALLRDVSQCSHDQSTEGTAGEDMIS